MLEQVQGTLTIDALMTEREELVTLGRSENSSEVQDEVRDLQINQVPILDGDSVAGILVAADHEERTLPNTEEFEPVSPEWLVSADTSIRRLIDILDDEQHPARFVFQENRVIGLVTYADLNKAIARTALYLLISRLEINLARLLSHYDKGMEELLTHLSETREEKLRERQKEMSGQDVAVDLTEHLFLTDLFRMVGKEPDLYEALGFESRSKFDDATNGLNELRKRVAHPVRFVVEGVDTVGKVNRRCKRIKNLLQQIPSRTHTRKV